MKMRCTHMYNLPGQVHHAARGSAQEVAESGGGATANRAARRLIRVGGEVHAPPLAPLSALFPLDRPLLLVVAQPSLLLLLQRGNAFMDKTSQGEQCVPFEKKGSFVGKIIPSPSCPPCS